MAKQSVIKFEHNVSNDVMVSFNQHYQGTMERP